jgi:proteic killer suppression protein
MSIRSFQHKELQLFFETGKYPKNIGWRSLGKIIKRKLDMLNYAKDLGDLKSPPSNNLEILKGDLKGFYSIRVNLQWRVIFRWDQEPADVDIVDYH